MTFSNPEVAAFIKANFVAAWHNRGPGFFNADLSTEKWIFTSSMEAYPTKNICTFFLTPEGQVFHYVAGFYSPDLFLKFLKTAVELRKALFDEKMAPRESGVEAARRIHDGQARVMDLSLENVKAAGKVKDGWRRATEGYRSCNYRGLVHRHGPSCVGNLEQGYDYLSKLHRKWREAPQPQDFEAVRFAYLWGNPFTEEKEWKDSIAGEDSRNLPDPRKAENAGKLSSAPLEPTNLRPQGALIDLFGGK